MSVKESDHIVTVTDSDFEEKVLQASGPVLLDFWAEWCGPCKMIAPILDELAETMAGKVTIAKMNVDENNGTPAKFGVRGIPTLLLFKGGEVAGMKVGAVSKSQLQAFIETHA